MRKEIIAKAFVYGKNIDTDQIYTGRFLELVKPKDFYMNSPVYRNKRQ